MSKKASANEKGKLLGIINIFDLSLILLLIIVIAGGLWYFNRPVENTNNVNVFFTVEFTHKNKDFADKIVVGAQVKDSVKGYYLGVVDAVTSEPMYTTAYNQLEKKYETNQIEGLYTVKLTVRANGTESDMDIKAEGQVVKVGKEMFIKGKGFASKGYIIDLLTTNN